MAEAVLEDVTPKKQPIDFAVALTLKRKGLTYKQIAEKLGCNANSLRVLFARKGLPAATAEAVTIVDGNKAKEDAEASERGRKRLASEFERQLTLLQAHPVTYSQLPRHVAMTKQLAEGLKIAHGWGNDSVTIQFGVSMLSDRPEPKAIEVQASVAREAGTVAAPTETPPDCSVSVPSPDTHPK